MTRNSKVIVVGDDFSPMSEDAILEALQLIDAGVATTLHIVHAHDVGEDVPISDRVALERDLLAGTPGGMRKRACYLAAASALACEPSQIVTRARVGKPVQVLLETAVEVDADLVIVGTQGRSGVARWLLGSVAETLVRRARCPVLVARPKAHLGAEQANLPESYYASAHHAPRGAAASPPWSTAEEE